jgi:PAS domain S-box-containing protein
MPELNNTNSAKKGNYEHSNNESCSFGDTTHEDMFRALFQNSGTASCILNPEGYIEMANEKFAILTNDNLSNIIGKKHWSDYIHSEDLKIMREYNEKRMNGGRAPNEYEFRLVDKKGEIKHIILTIDLIQGSQRRIASLIDISNIKAIEIELIENNKQLIKEKERAEESDRLKSTFLTNISHEIRTPMNGIMGFVNLIREEKPIGEELDEYMNIISKSSERMLETINALLDISMIESGMVKVRPSKFALATSIKEITDLLQLEAQHKGLKLYYEQDNLGYDIHTDKDKFCSIISNLVRNAIKFTEKGHIIVHTQCDERTVLISVTDTGVGIPKDKIEKIFNRFEQADQSNTRKFEGSGLGLTITKAYVNMLGGSITVESKEGEGTCFKVILPAEVKKNNHTSKITQQIKQMKPMKIMIVEDDMVSQQLTEIIVKELGAETILAENGAEAVELFKRHRNIDLILMDIKMPIMNGFDACSAIREIDPDVQIIAQTAHAMSQERIRILDHGFSDYISKPIIKSHLFLKIDNAINSFT